MIVIESIKTYEVEKDYCVVKHGFNDQVYVNNKTDVRPLRVVEEVIYGHRYVINGVEISMGLTTTVEKALGFTMDEYKELKESNSFMNSEFEKLTRMLNKESEELIRADIKISLYYNKFNRLANLNIFQRLWGVVNPKYLGDWTTEQRNSNE